MSIGLSPENITLHMKLGAEYDVIYSTGPFVEGLLNGTLTRVNDTVFPANVTSVRNYLFQNNTLLTSVELSNVTDIGIASFASCAIIELSLPAVTASGMQAFSYNPMTSVVFPSLSEVGTQMFQGCNLLETADFPVATVINRSAFYNCESLTTLILRAGSVVELSGSQHFYNTPIEGGTGYIYVPNNLVDSYKADEYWSVYEAQIRSIDELEVE